MFLVFLVLAIVAGAWVASFEFFSTRSTLEQSIGETHEILARQTFADVDRVLYSGYLGIQDVASENLFLNLFDSKVKTENEGMLTVRLNRLTQLSGTWDALKFVDKNNTILLSTLEKEKGKQIADDNVLRAIIHALQGETYYSDVVYTPEENQPTVIFAAPVRDTKNGAHEIVGVALGYFSWNAVLQVLEGSHGLTHLYNKEGILIGTNTAEEYRLLLVRDDFHTASFQSATNDVLGSGSLVQTGLSGASVLHTHVKESGLLGYRGSGWVLVTEEPAGEALASARMASTRLTAILLPTLLLFFLLILLWLIHIIERPVVRLTETVRMVAGGNLEVEAPIFARDEIGELALAFNKMTNKLRLSYVDIEDRKRTLAQEQDKVDAIIQSIGDGVFVVDKNLVIQIFNPVAEFITGFTREEAIGKRYTELLSFVSEKDHKVVRGSIEEALLSGSVVELPESSLLISKKHKEVPVADSAAPLKDVNGKVTGVVVVFRDVTQEHAVARAKTEFVSLASHQMRTPLTSVKWYLEVLIKQLNGMIPEPKMVYLQKAYSNAKRMTSLVDALLHTSRVDLGKLSHEKKAVDIGAMIGMVCEEMARAIEEKGLTLTQHIAKTSLVVMGDREVLHLIVENLFTNAVKYTPSGGHINVSLEHVGVNAMISVEDTGYGVPLAEQSKIFQKLYRAENVRSKETYGNGLGLYIVKSAVEEHGGRIWFFSEEGRGTVFHVTLPLRKEGENDSIEEQPASDTHKEEE